MAQEVSQAKLTRSDQEETQKSLVQPWVLPSEAYVQVKPPMYGQIGTCSISKDKYKFVET